MDDEQVDAKYLEVLLRHVELVQQNCTQLGKMLIEEGQSHFGLALIRNGLHHDASKFTGIEWDFLKLYVKQKISKAEKSNLELAASQHTQSNPHHPEYWGSIHAMPDIYIAEMVCDWKARATEFGTNLREWIVEEGTIRYGFKTSDPIFEKITKYVDMLCGKPMEKLKPNDKAG